MTSIVKKKGWKQDKSPWQWNFPNNLKFPLFQADTSCIYLYKECQSVETIHFLHALVSLSWPPMVQKSMKSSTWTGACCAAHEPKLFGACASWRRRHMQFSFVPSRSRRRTALPPFFLLLHAIPYHAWPIFVQSSFRSCTAESIARPRPISLWPIASRTSSTSSSSSSIPPKTRKSRVYESSPTPESGLPPHSCRYTLDDLELEKLYILRRLLHSRTHHERQNGEAFAMWGRKELFFSVVQGTAKLLEWENSRC